MATPMMQAARILLTSTGVYVRKDLDREDCKPGQGDLRKELTADNIRKGWEMFRTDYGYLEAQVR